LRLEDLAPLANGHATNDFSMFFDIISHAAQYGIGKFAKSGYKSLAVA